MGEHKKQLGLLSNGCLLPIPWSKLSQAQVRRRAGAAEAHVRLALSTRPLTRLSGPTARACRWPQPSLLRLGGPVLLVLLLVALLLHVLFLALNYAAATLLLRLPPEQRKAARPAAPSNPLSASIMIRGAAHAPAPLRPAQVVIMCSQKTLPMALTVLAFFPPELGEQGLIAIPCVVSHIVQIFFDAVVAARWAAATADGPNALV